MPDRARSPHPGAAPAPSSPEVPPKPGALRMTGRALRLRCPVCGRGRLFDGWTHLRRRCVSCGLILERGEEDYFIGAYLLNLIVAELIVVALMLIVLFATWPSVPWQGMLWAIVALTIPAVILTYPFSRALWLAIDLMFRPAEADDFAPEAEVIDIEELRRRKE